MLILASGCCQRNMNFPHFVLSVDNYHSCHVPNRMLLPCSCSQVTYFQNGCYQGVIFKDNGCATYDSTGQAVFCKEQVAVHQHRCTGLMLPSLMKPLTPQPTTTGFDSTKLTYFNIVLSQSVVTKGIASGDGQFEF